MRFTAIVPFTAAVAFAASPPRNLRDVQTAAKSYHDAAAAAGCDWLG